MNTAVIDFICPECASPFQLKSQSRPFSSRITDAAYEGMRRAIQENRTPNLVALQYHPLYWTVQNLVLIPRFAFTLSCIEKRKPLGLTAQRKGWIGCNILLVNIPLDARIRIISEGVEVDSMLVRRQYSRLRPLERFGHDARGWTLDVLNVVRSLGKPRFSLGEVYDYSDELQRLHPKNRHVREKIRQQLQLLRSLGLLEFLGGGNYAVKSV